MNCENGVYGYSKSLLDDSATKRSYSTSESSDSSCQYFRTKVRTYHPDNWHSKCLYSHVNYIPYPPIESLSHYTKLSNKYCMQETGSLIGIFIGQLPYELSSNHICWIIDTLLGKFAVKYIEQRIFKENSTWAYVYIDSQFDAQFLYTYNKCMLFDTMGIWCARTTSELLYLSNYIDRIKLQEIYVPDNIPRNLSPLELKYTRSDKLRHFQTKDQIGK